MGYTHYWDIPVTVKSFGKAFPILKEIIRIGTEKGILCYEFDQIKRKPKCTKTAIRFNGKGVDGHETFCIDLTDKPKSWHDQNFLSGFCKTRQDAYDLYVCLCLLCLNQMIPGFTFGSDGDDNDWEEAYREYEELKIKFGIKNLLKVVQKPNSL